MKPDATAPHRRRVPRYLTAGLLVLAAALLAAGYGWRATSRPAGPLEHVTIANTAYAGTCPVLVAQRLGHFEDEGLRVTLRPYTTGKAALDAMLKGDADLATSAELPIVFAAIREQPVTVIATILVAEKDYGIVARRDRGIATPAELKGRRIGVTVNTSGHFVLDAFLNRQKLTTGDVEVRDFKPEELAGAMARGDIDAASTWEPYLNGLREQLGDNGAAFSVADVYDSLYNLSGSRDYVVKHPVAIRKVLRALIRGGRYCKESPQAASEIVAANIEADAATLRALWPSYRFGVRLDQSLLLALEDQTRWAMKNGLAEGARMPNYLNHMYMDGLEAVAPAVVTMMH